MHVPARAGSLLVAFLGLSSLWGCAGGGGASAPSAEPLAPSAIAVRAQAHTVPNVLRPDVARELSVIPGSVRSTGLPAKGAPSVYSCEYYGSDCRIYDGVTHKHSRSWALQTD